MAGVNKGGRDCITKYFVSYSVKIEILANQSNSCADSVHTVVSLYKVKINLGSLFSELRIATDLFSFANCWNHYALLPEIVIL